MVTHSDSKCGCLKKRSDIESPWQKHRGREGTICRPTLQRVGFCLHSRLPITSKYGWKYSEGIRNFRWMAPLIVLKTQCATRAVQFLADAKSLDSFPRVLWNSPFPSCFKEDLQSKEIYRLHNAARKSLLRPRINVSPTYNSLTTDLWKF